MAAVVAVVLTAAMIRCRPWVRSFNKLLCELCGDQVAYVTESGDQLCAACMLERRKAWRDQNRAAVVAEARAKVARAHEERKAARLELREYEGEVSALDLARDGFFDLYFEEWSGSETIGPKPRWVMEASLTDHVEVSPSSLARAIYALLVAVYLPIIRGNALLNARVQLGEAWVVSDGYRDVVTMYDGTDDRDMGDDVLPWLHRDGQMSKKRILDRWGRPDDEQDFLDEIRAAGRESEWWELMVDFRRRKLDSLLKEYFGLDDYRASMIVLKWEKGSSGRWKPAKQMNVVEWVKWSCEESGSILGGLQSCTRSIQMKTQLRKRKEASKARV
jgi:hypothetical protein